MSAAQRRLQRALRRHLDRSEPRAQEYPGLLGTYINDVPYVRVPNRPDFVYVRLHGKQTELIRAFNSEVGDFFDLPVIVRRDRMEPNHYRVIGRNVEAYSNWGGFSYVPFHGEQHSFTEEEPGGSDIVWVMKRQFMPLLLRPNAFTGSLRGYVEEDYYLWNDEFKHWDRGTTVDFGTALPSGNVGRFITVVLDGDTDSLTYLTGTAFNALLPPTDLFPYIEVPTPAQGIPVGAVLLTSTLSQLTWDELFDIRVIVQGAGDAVAHQHLTEEFSGISGTSAFVLSNEPTDMVHVTINGFVLVPSLFTQVGTSVTLDYPMNGSGSVAISYSH